MANFLFQQSFLKQKSLLYGTCVLLLFFHGNKPNTSTLDSLWTYMYNTFEFLPEYHIDVDLTGFMFHKNDFFKERYYLESNTNLEFCFISFRKIFCSVYYFEFQTGMGQTPGNVVFDPMDINFGIVPVLEFRFPSFNLQCGLNHHCFHEIDRKDFKTVYWNKPFIAVGSKNMRLFDYWSTMQRKTAGQ